MSNINQSINGIIQQACVSYIDILPCKEFSSGICHSTFVSELQDCVETQDLLPVRKVSFEDDQNKVSQQQGSHSIRILLKDGDDEDEEDEDDYNMFGVPGNGEDTARNHIFRAGQKRPPPQESGHSELRRLYRCTAWSMDSKDSDDKAFSTHADGETPVSLVHWYTAGRFSSELQRHILYDFEASSQ
jgi:hypothetical protein